jgi:hypothetical protein
MILSRKWGVLLVKGKKVAGTSVEMALSRICGPDDIITPFGPLDELRRLREFGTHGRNYAASRELEQHYLKLVTSGTIPPQIRIPTGEGIYYNHMSLLEVEDLGNDTEGILIFCVERSPYAKVLSYINMALVRKRGQAGQERRVSTLEEIKSSAGHYLADGSIRSVNNIGLYKDRSGHVAAEVLCYERLADDFAKLLRRIGAPSIALPRAKPGINSNSLDPKQFFRRDQIEQINAMFREEFSAFGYKML